MNAPIPLGDFPISSRISVYIRKTHMPVSVYGLKARIAVVSLKKSVVLFLKALYQSKLGRVSIN